MKINPISLILFFTKKNQKSTLSFQTRKADVLLERIKNDLRESDRRWAAYITKDAEVSDLEVKWRLKRLYNAS